jgi:hypothetical protein
MIKYFRYVVHSLIPAYEALGWVRHSSLDGCRHGDHASLMEWKGEGEPREPQS